MRATTKWRHRLTDTLEHTHAPKSDIPIFIPDESGAELVKDIDIDIDINVWKRRSEEKNMAVLGPSSPCFAI